MVGSSGPTGVSRVALASASAVVRLPIIGPRRSTTHSAGTHMIQSQFRKASESTNLNRPCHGGLFRREARAHGPTRNSPQDTQPQAASALLEGPKHGQNIHVLQQPAMCGYPQTRPGATTPSCTPRHQAQAVRVTPRHNKMPRGETWGPSGQTEGAPMGPWAQGNTPSQVYPR